MSLTQDQKKDLEKLSRELQKFEQIAIENNMDLDVFISTYNEQGFEEYTTERVSLEEAARKRKQVMGESAQPVDTKTHEA